MHTDIHTHTHTHTHTQGKQTNTIPNKTYSSLSYLSREFLPQTRWKQKTETPSL